MLFRYQIAIQPPTKAEATERDEWLRDQVGQGVKRWTAHREPPGIHQPIEQGWYMRFRYHQDAMAFLLRWGSERR